jgi:hypothetical protein
VLPKADMKLELLPGQVNIDYAADDSCEIRCWCRGHVDPDVFRTACALALTNWDGREADLANVGVSHATWRTVRAPAELAGYGVCEFIHVESAPGRGAYSVTVLTDWLPLSAPAGKPVPWELPQPS